MANHEHVAATRHTCCGDSAHYPHGGLGRISGTVDTFAIGAESPPGATMHIYEIEVTRDYLRLLAYWRGCKRE